MDVNSIEITPEMIQCVAIASLYREDVILELRKVVRDKLTNSEMQKLYTRIINHPNFNEEKQNAINIEKASLIDDDSDTIMLYYNKLLRDAQYEKKYDVAARILKEIRQLKAIDNEQIKFEVVIKVQEPKDNK